MKSKWLLTTYIITTFLLLCTLASAEEIILVSDNDADLGVASVVSTEMNYTLVMTRWGQFEDNTLQTILNRTPENVLIIGGTQAVVSNYEDSLLSNNISVEQIGGQTRQQTSLQVYERRREQLKSHPLICSGISPILTNDTIPVYYYNNQTEMLSFAEQHRNRARVTNQNETSQIRERFGLTVMNVTHQMVQEVHALIQSVKSNATQNGYALGPQVSEIVHVHGQEISELSSGGRQGASSNNNTVA